MLFTAPNPCSDRRTSARNMRWRQRGPSLPREPSSFFCFLLESDLPWLSWISTNSTTPLMMPFWRLIKRLSNLKYDSIHSFILIALNAQIGSKSALRNSTYARRSAASSAAMRLNDPPRQLLVVLAAIVAVLIIVAAVFCSIIRAICSSQA